jgi:hypothetical protein
MHRIKNTNKGEFRGSETTKSDLKTIIKSSKAQFDKRYCQ